MASLINLTVIRPTTELDFNSPCQLFSFNVADIQMMEDNVDATNPGAKTKINLKHTVANHFKARTIYVNEVRTAIVTSSNA